jgi:hypothetical protein
LIQQKSLFKTYAFWYVLIGVLLILTLFLPFRINVVEAGSYVGLFGHTLNGTGSRKVISGFNLLVPFIPIGIYLVTTLFMIFSKGKVGKVFALIFSFFHLWSLLVVWFFTSFSLSFSGRFKAITGTGYYIMVFLSLIFIVIVCVNVAKTWKGNSEVLNLNQDLLDN